MMTTCNRGISGICAKVHGHNLQGATESEWEGTREVFYCEGELVLCAIYCSLKPSQTVLARLASPRETKKYYIS